MQKINTILVPSDFSKHSEHALHYAASLGERFGATVHLLHVVTLHGLQGECGPEVFPDMASLLQRADSAAREKLDRGADESGAAEVQVIKALTRSVNAFEAIVDYAKRKSVGLIIIATRGNTGLAHVLLGSVTERVVRYAPCPVLVVEEGDRDFVDPETGAVTIKRVVIADDFSDAAKHALERAVKFLAPYKPEIHLVHAVETEVPPVYALAGVESVFQLHPDLNRKLTSLLQERAKELIPEDWKVTSVINEGKPHRVVTEYTEGTKADLLVVAAETNIDIGERIMGGTTERIVRRAPCPILVI